MASLSTNITAFQLRSGKAWFAVVLVSAMGLAGYQQLFSTFAPYDDEGYVMLSLASYRDGKPLYDETSTQYGPALFALQSAFHTVTGLPISHDVTRLRTLSAWLLIAALAGALVYRLTGHFWLASASSGVAFLHLDRFCL
ncbi:MAG: hypothetical protein KDA61_12275, partial [Planctomycetales bacterium]|nr:hypothetical protein [Planctomycetales bacterium]